jgi:hypothetical protein
MDSKESALTIRYLSSCDGNCMGKSLCIDRDVALDPSHFLSCIVALRMSAIRIFYTLCVDDQKARRGFAPLFCTDHANYIFLKAVPEHLRRLDQAHSTWKSTHAPFRMCAMVRG